MDGVAETVFFLVGNYPLAAYISLVFGLVSLPKGGKLPLIKTRPDTRAKTVRLALLILRSIPSSILSSIHLTVDEYDNEWNDEKHDFLHLSRAISDLSQALSDLTVEKYNDEWNEWMNEWINEWMTSNMIYEKDRTVEKMEP